MKTTTFLRAVAALAFVTTISTHAQDVFTWAGYTFDQRNTPDQANLLGGGVNLGGANFSSGFPTQNGMPYPQFGGPSLDPTLSLARLTGLGSSGTQAVSLPNGNDGNFTRHGIEVTWSGGRTLSNLLGADFVVYESASTIAGTEGVMARAGSGGTWTSWYYFAPDGFQLTDSPEGTHSYGFDLSDMGVSLNSTIDFIQIANLTSTDRISGTSEPAAGGTNVGSGLVLFGTGSVHPDAGDGFDANRIFSTTQFDADPLYLAALHDLYIPPVPEPSSMAILAAIGGIALWRRKTTSR